MHSDWRPQAEDIAFFQSEGYWIGPQLIEAQQLALLREHMDQVFEGTFETGRPPWRGYWKPSHGNGLRKTDNAHWADRVLGDLAVDARIGEMAARLMGGTSTIRLWHDQLLYKPGQGPDANSAKVGWHQDYHYWQCALEPTLLTAWVAFDDVDLANGCMQFLPKSHRWGLLPVGNFFDQETETQMTAIRQSHPEAKPVPVILKAGQVSFHHCLTFHGSGPNTTSGPRRSLAIHLMTDATRYCPGTESDGHMNVELFHPRPGQRFSGPEFPVVFMDPS